MNDYIDRQAAIEVLTRAISDKFTIDDWYERLLETGVEIEDLIKELPRATPTERTGKWIGRNDDDVWNYCSVCGEQSIDLFNYCPNCGAKMDLKEEAETKDEP